MEVSWTTPLAKFKEQRPTEPAGVLQAETMQMNLILFFVQGLYAD